MKLKQRTPGAIDALPDSVPAVLRRLYAARGLVAAAELRLDAERLLPPVGLKGIDAAAALLEDAIRRQRRIVVAADYDADGATACAVMVLGLQRLGAAPVGYVVPDRFKMGYGLSPGLADLARGEGAELLLTVDNGIASVEGVAHAKALGMTVVITDHHLPGAVLPDADAIVNPNQPGCDFGSKSLAGVGVAFYLLLAVRARLRDAGAYAQTPAPNLGELLDLVALGTVADVVRLDYNNRILVEQGLRRIRAGRARPGIAALLQVAAREPGAIGATDLGFVLGPRLNAAGRLEDMRLGIACLLAPDLASALPMAKQLDALNRERRGLQKTMSEEALALTDDLDPNESFGVCATDAGWHEGIVGLIASRLREAHHRPAIAFAPAADGVSLKGSARSVEGFHIRDALVAVAAARPGLIERFGGHAMAAGLTLPAARYAEFAACFDAVCRATLSAASLERVLETDGELGPDELCLATARLLDGAQPWGQGFPAPVFEGCFEVLATRLMGSESQHVRYTLRSDAGNGAQAVHFGGAEQAVPAGRRARLAYTLDINRWQGSETLQLVLRHVEAE